VLELTFVFGPPLALGLGALWSTGAALALSGVAMFVSTLAFAAQPASRRLRPDPDTPRPRGGSLRSPAMRALLLILLGTVRCSARPMSVSPRLRRRSAAPPPPGRSSGFGVSSLLGGIAATRLGGGARRASGLTLLLAALAVSHGALIVATGDVLAIGAVILLAGATIAPTEASVYAMVDRAAPAGTRTEAFSWLVTASSTGAAVGAAVAGALAQTAGAPAAFAFAGAAGGLAMLTAALASRRIDNMTPEPVGAVQALAV
jgi:predicted MFS family arabinose efflux permease